MIYQTYRRVNIPSAPLAYLYLAGVAVVLAVVLPFMALRPNRAHMVAVTGVPVTRFLSTEPSSAFSSSEHSVEQLVRDCTVRHASAPCEYWDWLEVVEGANDDLFLTTHVDDVIEGRRKAYSSSDSDSGEAETRAAAPWREIESTRFSYFTADPESTPIRLRQGVAAVQYGPGVSQDDEDSTKSRGTVTAATTRTSSVVEGWMMNNQECDLLRGGADFSTVVSTAKRHGRDVRRLAGNGDDRFTLVDLLAVADPEALVASDDGTKHLTTIDAELGLEVHVNTVVSNVFSSPPLAPQDSSSWNLASQFASSAWDAFVPGITAYYVCVVRADQPANRRRKSGKQERRGATMSEASRTQAATLSLFTAPAEWSRVPIPSVDLNHSKGNPGIDTRLLRRATGARIVFRSEALVYRVTPASFLSFLAGSLALLSIPWSVTEGLITYANVYGRAAPPWWRAFIREVPPG